MNTMSDEVNRIFQRLAASDPNLFRSFRRPNYRYYVRPGSKDQYFYTTEKVNHKGKPRYVAGIYRFLKSRNALKLVKRSGFAKRYKADEAAKRFRDAEEQKKAAPHETAP